MSVVNLPYLTIEPVEKNMNKSELIKSFAEQNDLSIDEASTVVTIFFDSIEEYLVNNKRVELRGFGSFKIKEYGSYIRHHRAARRGDSRAAFPAGLRREIGRASCRERV